MQRAFNKSVTSPHTRHIFINTLSLSFYELQLSLVEVARCFCNAIMMISAFTFRWKKFWRGRKFPLLRIHGKWFVSWTLSGLCQPKGRLGTESYWIKPRSQCMRSWSVLCLTLNWSEQQCEVLVIVFDRYGFSMTGFNTVTDTIQTNYVWCNDKIYKYKYFPAVLCCIHEVCRRLFLGLNSWQYSGVLPLCILRWLHSGAICCVLLDFLSNVLTVVFFLFLII